MSAAGLSEALFARLGAITSGTRWYPMRLPEGCDLPAGTYQRISSVPTQTHSGSVDIRPRRYQLTVYSETYRAGLEVARDITAGLDGIRGTWSGWTVVAMLADDAEDIDPEPRGLFRQRVDVFLRSTAP